MLKKVNFSQDIPWKHINEFNIRPTHLHRDHFGSRSTQAQLVAQRYTTRTTTTIHRRRCFEVLISGEISTSHRYYLYPNRQ